MFPVRLIYASTISSQCDPDDIQNILEVARDYNSNNDVTGLLFFSTDYFLQCLEGPRELVNQLYHRIQEDPRHNRLILLHYEEIPARIFVDWSMAYLCDSAVDPAVVGQYFGPEGFNPYQLNGNTACSLIRDLSQQLDKSDLL